MDRRSALGSIIGLALTRFIGIDGPTFRPPWRRPKRVELSVGGDGEGGVIQYGFERPYDAKAVYASPKYYSGRRFWGRYKGGWIAKDVPEGESSEDTLLALAKEIGDPSAERDFDTNSTDIAVIKRNQSWVAQRLMGIWMGRYQD